MRTGSETFLISVLGQFCFDATAIVNLFSTDLNLLVKENRDDQLCGMFVESNRGS